MDKPKSNPDINLLPAQEYNQLLQQTYAYFGQQKVRITTKDENGKPDGRIGSCIGVDPRPKAGGADGNFLCISVKRAHCKPGQTPVENVYFMPDDVELVDPPKPEPDLPPHPVGTTTTTS